MKRIVTIFALAIMCMTACNSNNTSKNVRTTPNDFKEGTSSSDNTTNNVNKGSQKNADIYAGLDDKCIILHSEYINFAWGYTDNGFFVTNDGSVYKYDFSQTFSTTSSDNSEIEIIDKLNAYINYTDPICKLDANTLAELKSNMSNINPNATFDTEPYAMDAGSRKTCIYIPSDDYYKPIDIRGDSKGFLDCPETTAIMDILTTFKDTQSPDNASSELFIFEDTIKIHNLHCGYISQVNDSSQYIISNEEEVDEFFQKTGIDLSTLDWNDDSLFEHDDVYIVCIKNVPSTGYSLSSIGIYINQDGINFIPNPEDITPDDSDTVGAAMDGFCFAARVRSDALDIFYDETDGTYKVPNTDSL